MALPLQSVETIRGDSKTFALTLNNHSDGSAFVHSGWFLILTVKLRPDDGSGDSGAVVQKSSNTGITSAGASSITVEFVPADTAAMEVRSSYVFDVQAQHSETGEVRTVAMGRVRNIADVTEGTTVSIPIYTSNPSSTAYPWALVTGKPTTLAGYGITDALTTAQIAAGYQPLDADLTAIAALTTTANGRSLLTASALTAAGLGLTNGAATDALSAVSTGGILTRTAANTYSARTFMGTANQISVTNGDGVAGNPTLSLSSSLTSINSITAAAAQNLTLNGGSSGASVTIGQGASATVTVAAPAASDGFIAFFTRNTRSFAIYSGASSALIGTTSNHALDFYANNSTTLARLTTTGNLLIGGTTDIGGSGGLKVFGSTSSTSTTTGALVVTGGVGIGGALFTGAEINAAGSIAAGAFLYCGTPVAVAGLGGNVRHRDDTGVIRWTTGMLGTAGATNYVIQDSTSANERVRITPAGVVTITATTASTSSTTGALVVGGGIGVVGNSNFGGSVAVAAALSSTLATGTVLLNTAASTGNKYFRLASTGGDFLFGLESSGGATFATGTSAYSTALITQNATALHFGTNAATRLTIAATGEVSIVGNSIKINSSQTPATAAATGVTGTVCWDASFVYVCTATNAWKRAALSTW